MIGLHRELNNDDIFVPEEGQRDFLCSNKESLRCPSLGYEYVESEINLNRAFDTLFEEVLKNTQTKYESNKIDSNILPCLHVQAGR